MTFGDWDYLRKKAQLTPIDADDIDKFGGYLEVKPVKRNDFQMSLYEVLGAIDKLRKETESYMFANNQGLYEQIKDVLNITSMEVECSPYSHKQVKIEGFIPNDFTCNLNINNAKKEYNNMYTNNTKRAVETKSSTQNNDWRKDTYSGIIRRNDTTRVDWTDGSKTIIVLEEGQKDLDMFHTFCIAFAKKCFGSTTNIMNVIKNCDTDAIEAARKKAVEEANKQAEEETKKLKEEMEKAAFEKAVQEKMFENTVFEEAIRRIQIREERKMNKDIVEMAVTDGSEE